MNTTLKNKNKKEIIICIKDFSSCEKEGKLRGSYIGKKKIWNECTVRATSPETRTWRELLNRLPSALSAESSVKYARWRVCDGEHLLDQIQEWKVSLLNLWQMFIMCFSNLKEKEEKSPKSKYVQIAKSFVFYINKYIRDKEMFDIHESFFFLLFNE